ncbi:MAG: hypothetical protein JOZ47_21820 [Kutzneria sp.]|nr:hypothetical protein [Kutzneria sp.]
MAGSGETTPADVETVLLSRPAWQLRWRAPELSLVLSERAAALAAGRHDETERLRAETLAVLALNRLARTAPATERAVSALRAADAHGETELCCRLRIELAACALAAGVPLTGVGLLRPVLQTDGVPAEIRADALVALGDCAAPGGRGGALADTLAEADQLYRDDPRLDDDAVVLSRALLRVSAARHHRRWGDLTTAVAAARDGLGLLDQLADSAADSGFVGARLVLELVRALVDSDETESASDAAETLLRKPVRAPAAAPVGWIKLALVTGVHLPGGHMSRANDLLCDVAASAERHQLTLLRAESMLALAHVHECAGRPAEALACLRDAHAAERRRARALYAVRAVLAKEFSTANQTAETPAPSVERTAPVHAGEAMVGTLFADVERMFAGTKIGAEALERALAGRIDPGDSGERPVRRRTDWDWERIVEQRTAQDETDAASIDQGRPIVPMAQSAVLTEPVSIESLIEEPPVAVEPAAAVEPAVQAGSAGPSRHGTRDQDRPGLASLLVELLATAGIDEQLLDSADDQDGADVRDRSEPIRSVADPRPVTSREPSGRRRRSELDTSLPSWLSDSLAMADSDEAPDRTPPASGPSRTPGAHRSTGQGGLVPEQGPASAGPDGPYSWLESDSRPLQRRDPGRGLSAVPGPEPTSPSASRPNGSTETVRPADPGATPKDKTKPKRRSRSELADLLAEALVAFESAQQDEPDQREDGHPGSGDWTPADWTAAEWEPNGDGPSRWQETESWRDGREWQVQAPASRHRQIENSDALSVPAVTDPPVLSDWIFSSRDGTPDSSAVAEEPALPDWSSPVLGYESAQPPSPSVSSDGDPERNWSDWMWTPPERRPR